MKQITEDQYRKLKQEVEDAQSKAERAKGALDQLLKRLKEEFDCGNVKEAKKLLKQFEQERDEARAAFQKAMENYEESWKKTDEEEE